MLVHYCTDSPATDIPLSLHSSWVAGFSAKYLIHEQFLDSQLALEITMAVWHHNGLSKKGKPHRALSKHSNVLQGLQWGSH